MSRPISLLGYGPVGRAVARRLASRGQPLRIVQRHKPESLPKDSIFVPADFEDRDQTISACSGVDSVICAVGIPYVSSDYTRLWPIVMRNVLEGCATSGARLVFADNLYMYGPQTKPLAEGMPLTSYGNKPRVRAEITRLWQEAHESGEVRVVAVRASDFYGPDVPTSVLTIYGVVRILAGKAAIAPYYPDHPHDFTYMEDFARALVTFTDAPDDAYGQAWHVPNAPTKSLRELLTLTASLIGVPPRITVLPHWLALILGIFRRDVRELREMRFQWDRPYLVDATKFKSRFWNDPTSFETGPTSTIDYYRHNTGRQAS